MTSPGGAEAVYAALEGWRREIDREREQKRAASSVAMELRQQVDLAISTIEQGMKLPPRPGATLQQIVEEALRIFDTRIAEELATVERLNIDINNLTLSVQGLEREREFAIAELIKALELPPQRGRGLNSAVSEAISMIHEAKLMIQENL